MRKIKRYALKIGILVLGESGFVASGSDVRGLYSNIQHFRFGFLGAQILAGAFLFSCPAANAQNVPPPIQYNPASYQSEWTRAFISDAEYNLHFRSYYLERDNPTGNGLEALAAGGWLGYKSGWYGDFFRIGLVGYTSQPVYAPSHRDGTLLLKPGQDGYSVLGQAYISLKAGDHMFTGYRQMVNQPEVNPQDIRMTPNTFEAYAFEGTMGALSYYGAYVDKMKKRNEDTFLDMAEAAGAMPGTHAEGMWLGTLKYAPDRTSYARISGYTVPNVLNSSYADFWKVITITDRFKWGYGAQIMYQASNGADYLTGMPFNTWSGGLDTDFIFGPLVISMAYNQTGSNSFYRSPYGSWAGYTSMIVRDFNRAGEQAYLIGFSYDFKDWNLPGFSMFANAVFGRNAIDPATNLALADTNEYDVTFDYKFTASYWPDYAKPLWVRARYAHIEDRLNGSTSRTDDYRVIVNYDLLYNGRGVRK